MGSRLLQLGLVSATVGTGLVLLAGTALADTSGQVQIHTGQSSNVTINHDLTSTVQQSSVVEVVGIGSGSASAPSATDTKSSGDPTAHSDTTSQQPAVLAQTPALGTSSGQNATVDSSNSGSPSATTLASTPSSATGGGISAAQQISDQTRVATAAVRHFDDTKTTQTLNMTMSTTSLDGSGALPVAIPSASDRHQPSPAQSSGVLTGLNQLLANLLVPTWRQLQNYQLPVAPMTAGIAVGLLTLAMYSLLLVTGFADTTRRSGFAHAPRSDLAAHLFSFATPQEMSLYVASVPPLDSFFGGV